MTRLYLDMDGVLADFDRAYEERFAVAPRSHEDAVLWANIDGCEDFFRTIPPCAGALEFFAEVAHLNPIILTACPKTGYPKAAQHKREWIREHLGADVVVLPVMGGTNKPLFMHAPGDVLIDDYRRNTEAWSAAGGVAILHRDWEGTRRALEAVMDVKPATNGQAPSVLAPIMAELERAMRKFPTWPTDPLHAVAVLGEEYGELDKAVLQAVYEPHKSTIEDVASEAIQTAAMAVRFVASLDRYEYARCDQHQQPALAGQGGW